MALTYSQLKNLGEEAPDFNLRATDGKTYSLESFADKKALVVVFTCNHCPYAIAVQGRVNALAKEYGPKNVALVGINPNSPVHAEDTFEKMKERAAEEGFVFPYLDDPTQEVARAYDAVCTPDPYVLENTNGKFLLRYHGRIDDNWQDESAVKSRELAGALDAILAGETVNPDQKPAMGCSIKWK